MTIKTINSSIILILASIFSTSELNAGQNRSAESCQLHPSKGARFVKLDRWGSPLLDQSSSYQLLPWSCVLDRHTQLVWEVKSTDKSLHNRDNRYTWYNEQVKNNGGFAGFPNKGNCLQSACDTRSYIQALNEQSHCTSQRWRLPNREELRSLVRYDIPYPGPTLEQRFFPNGLAQYYWTSSPDSDDKDSAWGIGFSFGFDYAYFKRHAGYVRAVYSNPSNTDLVQHSTHTSALVK